MVYKILTIIVLWSVGVGRIWAQEASFLLSKQRVSQRGGRSYALIHQTADSLYALRTNGILSVAEVEAYDKRLNFGRVADISPRDDSRYTGAINVQGHIYMLQLRYVHDKEADVYRDVSFLAYRVDTATFALAPDSIVLVKPFKMESNYYRGNFAVSPDRSKILLYDYEEDGDIEGLAGLTNIVNLRVFDNNFKLLWQRKVNLAPNGQAKRVVVVKKFRVNNQGSVGLLTDVFKEGRDRTYLGKVPTADPTLFFIGREESDFLRFTPNLGPYFYNQIDFAFDRRGHIHWLGCLSKQRYYQQSGFFYMQLNANCTKILAKTVHEFSPELIGQTLKKRPKPDRELRNFVFASWRIHPETQELTAVLERQPPSSFNFKSHQLLAFRLDTLGQLRWAVPIYKWGDLKESQEAFLSHYLFLQDDYAYIIYNSGIYAENHAIIARIDGQGRKQEKVLFSYRTQLDLLAPRLSYPVGDKLFICLQDAFFDSYRYGLLDLRKFFGQ